MNGMGDPITKPMFGEASRKGVFPRSLLETRRPQSKLLAKPCSRAQPLLQQCAQIQAEDAQ